MQSLMQKEEKERIRGCFYFSPPASFLHHFSLMRKDKIRKSLVYQGFFVERVTGIEPERYTAFFFWYQSLFKIFNAVFNVGLFLMQICKHTLEVNAQPFFQFFTNIHHDVAVYLIKHPLGVVAEDGGGVGLGEALPEHG